MVSCPAPRPHRVRRRQHLGPDLETGSQGSRPAVPLHPYQVRHTHASWLIDKGVDIEKVRHRLGYGDLTTTTRYVKILDEEDSTAADVMSDLLDELA